MGDTTTRLGLNQPLADGSDGPADVPHWIRLLAADLDTGAVFFGQGTHAARPAAGVEGRFYWETDTGSLFYDDGTAWQSPAPASVPVGAVMDWPWGSGAIPSWALLPYGQLLTQAAYPALQIVADDASGPRPHGGAAGVNFNLPDYRGRAGIGKDDMGGAAANRITAAVSGINGATLGATGGAEGVTLTTAQLPAHNHGITGSPSLSDSGHSHAMQASGNFNAPNNYINANGGTYVFDGFSTTVATSGITVGVGTLSTSNQGSGSAHQNTQPSIIVNKIIRAL